MNILVLGKFTGGGFPPGRHPPAKIGDRQILEVDIDNLDAVVERLAPTVSFQPSAEATTVSISFHCMDDFHPDALFQRLGIFRRIGKQVPARKDFEDELKQAARAQPRPAPVSAIESDVPPEEDAATLDRLLGKTPGTRELEQARQKARGSLQQTEVAEAVQRLAETAVQAGRVTRPLKDHSRETDAAAAGALMRELLHTPALQAMEAVWRSVDWLVRSIETGSDLKVFLLDIAKEEMRADLLNIEDIRTSTLYRKLGTGSGSGSTGAGFSLLIGNFTFDKNDPDVQLLGALGTLASLIGGPFIAEAAPAFVGCRSFDDTPYVEQWQQEKPGSTETWERLRASSAADWLALALPRVLLRLPYGEKSDPLESFSFEEQVDGDEHANYLWGNPAFACAILLATSYLERGWEMQPGDKTQIDGLPAFTYLEAGQTRLKPCAEVLLGERETDELLAQGLIPVLSHRDRNGIHLPWFQSPGVPGRHLAGPWDRGAR